MTAVAAEAARRVEMTLDEVAALLHPPLSRDQLGRIVAQLPGLRPVGRRPAGAMGGRPYDTYDAAEIMDLHHVLRRWL